MNVFSDTDFYHELIKRLFHPKSYFFYCVSYHIDSALEREGMKNEENYLLFGNLMDRLVAAEDKTKELEALSKIGDFANFYEKFKKGVKYLCDHELDTEQLKIEIERLAQLLVVSALSALQNPQMKNELKQFLGVSESKESVNVEETSEKIEEDSQIDSTLVTQEETNEDTNIDATEVNQQADNLQNQSAIKEMPKSGDEIHEPPSAANLESESGAALESPADFEELQKDRLYFNSGRDAGLETRSDKDSTKEGGSIFLSDSSLPSQPANEIELGDTFQQEIKDCLKNIKNNLQKVNRASLKECRNSFETLKTTAMIHGFENIESLAAKAENFISINLKNASTDLFAVAELLKEVTELIETMGQNETRPETEEAIKNLIEKLSHPIFKPKKEERIREQEQESENNNSQIDDNGDQPNTLTDFKIPGEDDEELLTILDEIKANQSEKKTPETGDKSQTNLKDFAAIDENETMHPMDQSEINPSSDSELTRKFEKFKEEAQPQLENIQDALATLREQADNLVALNALEIAAYSLYDLAMKLNLFDLGTHLGSVERLVKNIISRRARLLKKEIDVLTNFYSYLQKISYVNELNDSEFKNLLTRVHEVTADVELETRGGLKLDYISNSVKN